MLPWCKFTSIAWLHSGEGFFYTRHPAPPELAADGATGAAVPAAPPKAGTETSATENCLICFHRVGTPVEQVRGRSGLTVRLTTSHGATYACRMC